MYNVPPLFNIAFAAVKIFIPRRTLEKIVVIGGSRGGNVRKLLQQTEPVAGSAVVGGGGIPMKLGGMREDATSPSVPSSPSNDYAEALVAECFKKKNKRVKGGWTVLKPDEVLEIELTAEDVCTGVCVEQRRSKGRFLPSAFSPLFCGWECRAIDLRKSTDKIVDAGGEISVSMRYAEPPLEEVIELYAGKGERRGKARFLSTKGVMKVVITNSGEGEVLVLARSVVCNIKS